MGFRPHFKAHVSITTHPKMIQVFGDNDALAAWLRLGVYMVEKFAGNTNGTVLIRLRTLQDLAGVPEKDAHLAVQRFRWLAEQGLFKFREKGTAVYEIRWPKFPKKQGFVSRTPRTDSDSDSDSDSDTDLRKEKSQTGAPAPPPSLPSDSDPPIWECDSCGKLNECEPGQCPVCEANAESAARELRPKRKKAATRETPLPADWPTPDQRLALHGWWAEKRQGDLTMGSWLAAFRAMVEEHDALKKPYTYKNWNMAFQRAVREQWAQLLKHLPATATSKPFRGTITEQSDTDRADAVALAERHSGHSLAPDPDCPMCAFAAATRGLGKMPVTATPSSRPGRVGRDAALKAVAAAQGRLGGT